MMNLGKSKFLKYTLFMALAQKVPVAYCNNPGGCYLCDDTGCRVFYVCNGRLSRFCSASNISGQGPLEYVGKREER
jgi:hypothetical protein